MNISDQIFQAYPVGRLHAAPVRERSQALPIGKVMHFGGTLQAKLFRGKIKTYPEEPRAGVINRFLSYWGFAGRLHIHHNHGGKTVMYTDRWPFPDVTFFPGMEIDAQGRVLNGAPQERKRQKELTRLLEWWYLYLTKHPVPKARDDDCPFCRGVREPAEDRATLFDEWNHVYRHLKSGWLNGSFIDLALREWGYGEYGRRLIRGEEDGRPGYDVIFRAVRRYVYLRAGIPLIRGEDV